MPSMPPYRPPKASPRRELHLARMVLEQDPKPVNPSARLPVDVTQIEVPGLIDDTLPVTSGFLQLPRRLAPPRRVVSEGPGGLQAPWDHHPGLPALLLPARTVSDLRERDRWPVDHFVSPSVAGIPFSSSALGTAAWSALANVTARKRLITELAYLAAELDGLGYASGREPAVLAQMRFPELIERRIRLEMGPTRPLLDPRCIRWIVTELCVALAKGQFKAPEMTDEAWDASRLFLPGLGTGSLPLRRDVLRAVWFLHDDFTLGQQTPGSAADILAMTAAHAAGVRMFDEPDHEVLRGIEMWSTDDQDPHVVDRGVDPSAFRRAFEVASGLRIDEFLVLAMMESWALRAQYGSRPDAAALSRRLQLQIVAQPTRNQFIATVRREMTIRPSQLGRRVLSEMRRYGQPYTGLGSVPTHASEALRDRPVLELPGNLLLPVGQGMFLARAVELPAVVLRRRHGLSRRGVRGQVARLYEARLQRRVERLRGRWWVATGIEIDAVVDVGQRRPDAIVGSRLKAAYLMVEINAARLETGSLAGDVGSVEQLVSMYINKRDQADQLIADAPATLGRLRGTGRSLVHSAVPLVVVDEPLPVNPAFERAIRERKPDWNPRFVCSIGEFELLLDLAEAGWDPTDLVQGWRRVGNGQMLGTFLRTQANVTPRRRTVDWLWEVLPNKAA